MITTLTNQNLLDWFDQQTDAGIIHQANCFHKMGAGIARQIKERYPEAYAVDKLTRYGDQGKLGDFSIALVKDSQTRYVYNLYSQFTFGHGRETRYDAMVDGFEKIIEDAASRGLKVMGVPYNIGCKLGGGSWMIVEAILRDAFDPSWTDLDLFVCKYEP